MVRPDPPLDVPRVTRFPCSIRNVVWLWSPNLLVRSTAGPSSVPASAGSPGAVMRTTFPSNSTVNSSLGAVWARSESEAMPWARTNSPETERPMAISSAAASTGSRVETHLPARARCCSAVKALAAGAAGAGGGAWAQARAVRPRSVARRSTGRELIPPSCHVHRATAPLQLAALGVERPGELVVVLPQGPLERAGEVRLSVHRREQAAHAFLAVPLDDPFQRVSGLEVGKVGG